MFALDYILSAGSYYVQCDGIEKISVLWRVGKLAAVCIVSNKYLSSYLKFFFRGCDPLFAALDQLVEDWYLH